MVWTRALVVACFIAHGCGDDGVGAGDTEPASSSTTMAGSGSTSDSTTDPATASSTTGNVSTATTDAPTATESGEESSSSGGRPEPTYAEHYMGRFDRSKGAPRSTWSGSTARTRIDGTEVSIALDGPSGIHFQAVVDGTAVGEFVTEAGAQSYVVASGLTAGEHDIEVVRRNEGYFGVVTYNGFELGADTTVVETPWPWGLHIEFIGDSLTAGYGIECNSGEENFSAATESAYSSYAMVAGRILEASVHLVAFSGKGVYQNYGGNTDEPMPVLWPRTLTGQAEPEWDWFERPADVVVVNLGTNDFSAALQQNDFVDAYVALLEDVRSRYPDATIIGITWAHWGAEREGWVTGAIDQFNDPDTTIERFEIFAQEGYGCDYHTNVVTNQRFGEQLAGRIAGL